MAKLAFRQVGQLEQDFIVQALTDDGQKLVADVASRHGVSADAVHHLLMAIAAGHGRQAQFNHPELGGMGQWSQGGMIMVGDMFNQALKHRVDVLCTELSGALQNASPFPQAPSASQSQSQSNGRGDVSLFVENPVSGRWPAELGSAASTGSQNDLHYAVFPRTRRLAIERGGQVTVYDTGDHQISGFSQQQGGNQTLTFISQLGLVRLADLKIVSPGTSDAPDSAIEASPQSPPAMTETPRSERAAQASTPSSDGPLRSSVTPSWTSGQSGEEIFAWLERLADLREKGVITAEEFNAKKAELLARL